MKYRSLTEEIKLLELGLPPKKMMDLLVGI